ncbi:hypothetical protein CW304_27985 [Bacillus sp. UFRGS-B20]|nr:hypothetical protein CW304_27985 [Bacillus sp. UFRGS-B20]
MYFQIGYIVYVFSFIIFSSFSRDFHFVHSMYGRNISYKKSISIPNQSIYQRIVQLFSSVQIQVIHPKELEIPNGIVLAVKPNNYKNELFLF